MQTVIKAITVLMGSSEGLLTSNGASRALALAGGRQQTVIYNELTARCANGLLLKEMAISIWATSTAAVQTRRNEN
jgi:hypothetical protein